MRVSIVRATAGLVIALAGSACTGAPAPSSSPGATLPAAMTPAPGPTPTRSVTEAPSAGPAATAGPGWAAAGTLVEPRVGHTATLLQDGRVLVAGGLDIDGAKALGVELLARTSAELYDPVTGRWTLAAPMGVGRAFHTATLLPDGNVLVAGGGEADEIDARSAEVYNPAIDRWTSVGSMAAGRFAHAAFLLPSGAVLVVAGHGIGSTPSVLTSAERFDAVTMSWGGAADLADASYDQQGITLGDGRPLLVEGGYIDPATTWLYDTAAGTWTESGSMGMARSGFPLALLPGGAVLAPGGRVGSADGVLAAAQTFDPVSGKWLETGTMALQRLQFTATTLPDGRVIAIGGGAVDEAGARSAEIYDPADGEWSAVGSMANARFGHTATLLKDGTVLVVGGDTSDFRALAAAELYMPVAE